MRKILVIGITSILLFSGILVGASNMQSDDKNSQPLSFGCFVNLPEYEIQAAMKEIYGSGLFISYLETELKDIFGEYDVDNIKYPGWCIDYQTPLPWIPGTTPKYTGFVDVMLYSSCCPPEGLEDPDWDKVNYILTHKHEYEPYTWNDVHQAINYFVNFGNPVSVSSTWAQNMIALANSNPGFIPLPGDIIAIIVVVDNIIGEGRWQYSIIEVPVPQPPDEWCYEGETAWAQGPRYVPRGNWAMYYKYTGGITNTPLIAGQFFNAGSVEISDNTDGTVTITISLDDHWYFTYDDVVYEENVKIQDYANVPPKKNPAPGLFAHKFTATGQLFQCIVPYNNYYGIHVDLWHQVPCDMPLWYSLALRLCQLCQYLPNAFPLLRYILNNYNNY